MSVFALHLAVVRLEDSCKKRHRQIFEGLRELYIEYKCTTHLHIYNLYRRLGYKEGDFPEAERYSKDAISLIYPRLKEYEQERVVDA